MAILDNRRNRSGASPRAQALVIAIAAVALVPLSSLAWAKAETAWNGATTNTQHAPHSDSATFSTHLKQLSIATTDTNALLAHLSAPDALTRAASAWALGHSADPQVIDPLISAGYDADATVRQWAVRSLFAWNAPRIAGVLVDRLSDDDAQVRQWAVRGLQRHDSAVRTQPLIGALRDSDAEVRQWIVRVLASDNDNPQVRHALAGRVAIESDSETLEWLLRSLDGTDRVSIDALLGALTNSASDVRQWAIRSLGASQDARVVDALIGMLDDRDDEVREWSVRSLGVCGNQRAVVPLQALREDASADVQEWVGRALETIDC